MHVLSSSSEVLSSDDALEKYEGRAGVDQDEQTETPVGQSFSGGVTSPLLRCESSDDDDGEKEKDRATSSLSPFGGRTACDFGCRCGPLLTLGAAGPTRSVFF
jgi:hypothetical protein